MCSVTLSQASRRPDLRTIVLARRLRGGARRGEGARSKRRADGYEFAELRGYVAGDDPRRIDWAASARAGGLQTRLFFEDHSLFWATALDPSASMEVGRVQSGASVARQAAQVWFAAAAAGDKCAWAGSKRLVKPAARGRIAGRICAEQREPAAASYELVLRCALHTLPRGTVLLLVSDFYDLDALHPLLQACGSRFDTMALVIRDPWHDGLQLRGFVTLRDAETGRTARLFLGRRERQRFTIAVHEREVHTIAALDRCGISSAGVAPNAVEEAVIAAALDGVRTRGHR